MLNFKIPENLPKEMQIKIKEFSKSKSREEFLEKAFMYVAKKGRGNRFNLLFKLSTLFQKDINKIISSKKYLHCTTMNNLLKIMLVKSGLFSEEEIRFKWTNSWYIAPHQYLEVRVSDKKVVYLDPWNYRFGIDYGDYGRGFKSMRVRSVR